MSGQKELVLPRETVKCLMNMIQVCGMTVLNRNSGLEPPADLVTAYAYCKASVTDFLDNTTDDKWTVPVDHYAFLLFLKESEPQIRKMAKIQVIKSMMED